MNEQFLKIGTKKPMRGIFNLSYEKKFTCDMGYLIPIVAEHVVPGDIFNIGNEIVVRMQPAVAPILHEINIKTEYFFVPNRLIMGSLDEEDWENFITGGKDGTDTTTLDTWTPTGSYTDEGSLWDYFGFPTTGTPGTPMVPTGTLPLAFPRNAYNKVWNEWYRDENLQTERSYDDQSLALRNWEKDYFTASMPWLQRGNSPSLPITLSGTIDITGKSQTIKFRTNSDSTARDLAITSSGDLYTTTSPSANSIAWWSEPSLETDISNGTATSFNISDFRLAAQIQKFQELNARAGVRLTEFLQAHFNTAPNDSRLQRSEYIGGSIQPLIISEVLQTSESGTTDQGNMAGHGISAAQNYIAKYRVPEHGVILGLMSIIPRTLYQQGINRQWLYESRYDFPDPLFVDLSEQEVYQAEIFVTNGNATANETIFGYIGRYDEMRTKQSMVCGSMRSTFDYWHLSRQFTSAPTLNSSFLQCNPRKDFLAVTTEDGFIVSVVNKITAIRPIPTMNRPGILGV